jgi:hypothetical protein
LVSGSSFQYSLEQEIFHWPVQLSNATIQDIFSAVCLPICFFLQVIDDDGNVLPPGKEGDIGVRVKPVIPVGIFSGYVVRT